MWRQQIGERRALQQMAGSRLGRASVVTA